jgi:hypothetical protein
VKTKYATWWSANLGWLSTKVKRARKRFQQEPSLENTSIFNSLLETWERAIQRAKARYWKLKLETSSRSSIWKITKRYSQAHNRMLPPLGEATSFEQKYDILRKTLFPVTEIDVSNLDLSNLASYVDLTDVFSLVTPDEVSRALRKCDINTACGHDRIGYNTIIQLNTAVPDLHLAKLGGLSMKPPPYQI